MKITLKDIKVWYRKARQTPRLAIAWAILIGVTLGIVLDINRQPIVYVSAQVSEQEKVAKNVLIEVDYSKMSPERIEEIIRETLPPIFVEIAKCEGGLKPHVEGPTNDHGPLQIAMDYHGERTRKLGLDVVNNPYDNIKFARMLYDESGLTPWNASRKCWSK